MKLAIQNVVLRTIFPLVLGAVLVTGASEAASETSQEAQPSGEQNEESGTGSSSGGYDPLDQDSRLAIEGYDPVAYFTLLTATKGQDSINYVWLDKTWIFVNEEHRALFAEDPMHYLPNYGGFCSVDEIDPGHHLVHDIDPETWRIVDNKLYLFYAEENAIFNLPKIKWKKVKRGLP